jgi:hypothetical protein
MSPLDDDKYSKHRHQVKGSLFRSLSVVVGFLMVATLALAGAQHLGHPKAKAILNHPKVMAIRRSFKNAAHHHFNGEKFKNRASKLRGAMTKLDKRHRPHSGVGKSRGAEHRPKATEEQNTMKHIDQNTITDQELGVKVEQNAMAHDTQNTIADQRK